VRKELMQAEKSQRDADREAIDAERRLREAQEMQAERARVAAEAEAQQRRYAEQMQREAEERQKAFMQHARKGDLAGMQTVFQKGGIDVNWRDPDPSILNDSDRIALLSVVLRGRSIAIVKWLLSIGAAVDMKDKQGCTALHMADRADIARLLVDAGADCATTNGNGMTALDLRYFSLDDHAVKYLESLGAPHSDVCRFSYLAEKGRLEGMKKTSRKRN